MVSSNNQWRWDVFAHLLPMNIVMTLASYPPPNRESNEDQLFWDLSMNGEFTIKSAYFPLINSCDNQTHLKPLWRLVWRWRGLERIRSFLQLIVHNRAMTNEIRYKRHRSGSPNCHCGSGDIETILHVLRDCKWAREVWLKVLNPCDTDGFFAVDLHVWLLSNLSSIVNTKGRLVLVNLVWCYCVVPLEVHELSHF